MENSKNRKRSAEMNVLWTKGKLRKIFSRESIVTHVHASGDGAVAPGRSCRLCGGDTSLRRFADTCVWEGVEERFDHKLYECFGIMVSPSSDWMICEWCVRQLKTTERFRALVHAAFDKPPSEASSKRSLKMKDNLTEMDKKELLYLNSEKEILEILNTKIAEPRKRREMRPKNVFKANVTYKRTNIACNMCNQRYPMLMPTDGVKKFVCSRCKKNNEVKKSICRKCNIVMPSSMMKEHLELHVKANLRGKNRLCSLPKKPQQVKYAESVVSKSCLKKYATAQNLATQVRSEHEDSCTCVICGQNMKTRRLLDYHIKKVHTNEKIIFQCKCCMRIFKTKRALQMHSLTHEKGKTKAGNI